MRSLIPLIAFLTIHLTAADPTVALRFQVRAPNGQFVSDLKPDEIQLTDDGNPQVIDLFEAGQLHPRHVPTDVLILFDKAGAFRRQRPIDDGTIAQFLAQNPAATLSLYACGEELVRLSTGSRDVHSLITAFTRLLHIPPASFFNYPKMAQVMEDGIAPEHPRILVVFSESLGSDAAVANLEREARNLNIAVYPALLPIAEPVAYPEKRPPRSFAEHAEGSARFLKVAEHTGGQVLRAGPIGTDFVAPILDVLSSNYSSITSLHFVRRRWDRIHRTTYGCRCRLRHGINCWAVAPS